MGAVVRFAMSESRAGGCHRAREVVKQACGKAFIADTGIPVAHVTVEEGIAQKRLEGRQVGGFEICVV